MEQKPDFTPKGCLTLFVFFGAVLLGFYIYFKNSNDCVRTIPDGTVRCKCDMPSEQAWDDFIETTKGSYEGVVVEGKECD